MRQVLVEQGQDKFGSGEVGFRSVPARVGSEQVRLA